MDVAVTPYKHCSMVKLSGRLDSDTVDDISEEMDALIKAGEYRLVLDMSEVTFISSKGWWLLIDIQKKCRRFDRGEVVLACLSERIRNSLKLVGMDEYFKIFDDLTTAVGHF
jgi:anti-anti-sigma factor